MSNIAMWWKNWRHFTFFGGRLLTAFHSKDKQEFDHFYNVFVESLYDLSEVDKAEHVCTSTTVPGGWG